MVHFSADELDVCGTKVPVDASTQYRHTNRTPLGSCNAFGWCVKIQHRFALSWKPPMITTGWPAAAVAIQNPSYLAIIMANACSHSMPAERVCDYPRPPLVEMVKGVVTVSIGGEYIATTDHYVRICETYHPPTIYLPPTAFKAGSLHPSTGRASFCEWKGVASYWSLSRSDGSDLRPRAGWSYATPTASFAVLAGWISLYPGLVDHCSLDGEEVSPQPGSFYGGWITSSVIGPFKGDPHHPELI